MSAGGLAADSPARAFSRSVGAPTKNNWAYRILLGLLSFGTVSALAGGVLGVAANGAGVPLAYLEGTPFTSYLVPGLILGLIVGGTQALAAVTTHRRAPIAPLAAAVAGFGMTIWIFVELAITGYSCLQTVYLALGIGEVALVLVLLNILGTARTRSGSPPGRHNPRKVPQ